MPWYHKEHSTPFDTALIAGLTFIDGDRLADATGRDGSRGQKYPVVVFPSGLECVLWESRDPEALGIIHLFGGLDLPLCDTRDHALARARVVAAQGGCRVRRIGQDRMELWGWGTGECVLITYDNENRRMVDMHAAIDDVP